MKKILTIAAVLVITAIGIAYAEEGGTMVKDTFLNYIDPSNAEMVAAPAEVRGGSAAGGIRESGDTFLNYIDPSSMNEPSRGPVKSGKLDADKGDTFLKYIDPGSRDWDW